MTAQLINDAKLVLSLTDLTTLELDDTNEKVTALCHKATQEVGQAAAVCIYPKFIALAKAQTQGYSTSVATVVNFPAGKLDLEQTLAETKYSLEQSVDDVDLVFPYQYLLEQSSLPSEDAEAYKVMFEFVKTIADLCHRNNAKLKVILESGSFSAEQADFLALAAKISILAGADFIKTSTGKISVNATLEAARIMLDQVKALQTAERVCGFKASGGIRTVAEAMNYINLAREILGEDYIQKATFRFGASGIFNDIVSIITTGKALAEAKGTGY